MSVPLDKLYDFLQYQIDMDVVIYHWHPHGSRKLSDLQALKSYLDREYLYNPTVIFHDQEPYDANTWSDKELEAEKSRLMQKYYRSREVNYTWLSPEEMKESKSRGLNFITYNQYDQSVLVHSNFGLTQFDKQNHVPCFYWSHAIIAMDWFRFARHDARLSPEIPHKPDHTFLCYNRSWSGSREYRVKFSELLVQSDLHRSCLTWFSPFNGETHVNELNFQNKHMRPDNLDFISHFSPSLAESDWSAMYDASHYASVQWEVVLETIFDLDNVFLTEKVFRPIVCRRPFILAAAPGSLAFLHRYGFKTFGEYIDESYDTIQDPVLRLKGIMRAMQSAKRLSARELNAIQSITTYNFNRAFSDDFFQSIINEFKNNMSIALKELRSNRTGRRRFLPKKLLDLLVEKSLQGDPRYAEGAKFLIEKN